MKLIIWLLAPFLIIALTGCEEFKEVTVVGVESFYLNKITQEGIEAELNVKIKNPNDKGFSIYPSEFDIAFSGIRLGKAKLDKRVHIEKNTERIYKFKLKSKLSDLNVLDAMRLLNLENVGNIDVTGNLKAGKFYIKKSFPVSYTEKIKIFK